jgi:hypothetical protein
MTGRRHVEPSVGSGRALDATRHRTGHTVRRVRCPAGDQSPPDSVTVPDNATAPHSREACAVTIATANRATIQPSPRMSRPTAHTAIPAAAETLERDHRSDASRPAIDTQLALSVTDLPSTRAANSPEKRTGELGPCAIRHASHPANDRTPSDLLIPHPPQKIRPYRVPPRPYVGCLLLSLSKYPHWRLYK